MAAPVMDRTRALPRPHAFAGLMLAIACLVSAACASVGNSPRGALRCEVFSGAVPGYGVISTLVYGPREVALIDAQFQPHEAKMLADRIEALDRKLTFIFVTHSDADHTGGLAVLHQRFPDAQVFMTKAALLTYRETITEVRAMYATASILDRAPPVEPIATKLPDTTLMVDGHRVEIVPDLQGDVSIAPSNSAVWVPSLRTLVAGDLAFDHVHVYMERSTPAVRTAWRSALTLLEAKHPDVVIAGHKRDATAPNLPTVLAETRAYIEAFERQLALHRDAASLETAMRNAYADWGHPVLLQVTAASMFAGAGR